MADIPDKLIEGCRKGDTVCQKELYRLLAPKMYGVCLQYAGDRDEAKDLMQDAFIKVFNKIDQFTGKGSFEGWVRRIVINTALEKLRGQVKMESLDDKPLLNDKPVQGDHLDELSAAEIVELISRLSPQYRLVFNLYAIEGYNHMEIAEMLNISEGTSKSNLSRARAILQEKVNELYRLKNIYQEND